MPYLNKEEIEKVYYTIGEVAVILNCYTSKVRYYIDFFNIGVKKNREGHRRFNRKEVKDLVNIVYLVNNGMTLEGIKMAKDHKYYDDLIAFFMEFNFNYGVKTATEL